MPVKQDPFKVPLDDKITFLLQGQRSGHGRTRACSASPSQMAFDYEWKYLATSEGSYIEQEVWRSSPSFTAIARGKATKSRTYGVMPRTGGYEVVLGGGMLENAAQCAAEAVEHASAPPVGAGVKDLIMTPSHAMLTIHEIIAHPTELDRIIGYEANYAGTSFIKLVRRRQAEVRLEAVQRHRRSHDPGRHVHRSATTMTA